VLVIYFCSLDAEESNASIILSSAFSCCASWYHTK